MNALINCCKRLVTLFCLTCCFTSVANETAYVKAILGGQLGNHLFQIAAAHGVAWDHGAQACCPDLLHPRFSESHDNYTHMFFRCNTENPDNIHHTWNEPALHLYTPISYAPNMAINGYFQSEKYFKHHREKILNLFAPLESDAAYIQKKYGYLLNNPSQITVGIQFRWYFEDPPSNPFIQYSGEYLKKATDLFPGALFIVSTNRIEFAKRYMPENINVVYLQEPHYIEFRILSLCQHNIITNSSFGWWSAWLNKNPNKIVVAPKQWFNPNIPDMQDIIPEEWVRVDAKWGRATDPTTCD